MELRLGELLIDRGVLDQGQVAAILAQQHRTGEPFGVLAESIYGVSPATIEEAWAHQYARLTRTIDPGAEPTDARALSLVTRRQAWQFRVLPVRFDGPELMIATTESHLRRALRFTANVLGVPVYVVMSSPEGLGQGLCRHYPWPGMHPGSILDDNLDGQLAIAS